MVIVMQEGATDEQIQHVIDRVVASGFDVHRSTGASHTVLGAVGVHRDFDHRDFEILQAVREVVRITQPFKLASRQFKPEGTIVDLGRGVKIGGTEVAIAAGPCSVESHEQIHAVAEAGSFTHAGEVLKLSQSAVSRQISGLEKSLSTTLFHRHARGLILTEQGELLNQTVKEVFGKLVLAASARDCRPSDQRHRLQPWHR